MRYSRGDFSPLGACCQAALSLPYSSTHDSSKNGVVLPKCSALSVSMASFPFNPVVNALMSSFKRWNASKIYLYRRKPLEKEKERKKREPLCCALKSPDVLRHLPSERLTRAHPPATTCFLLLFFFSKPWRSLSSLSFIEKINKNGSPVRLPTCFYTIWWKIVCL